MPFSFAEREQRALEGPVSLIQEFLDQLRTLLRSIVRETVEGFDFRPDLGAERGLIDGALADTEERGYFERASEGIYNANLEDTGLTGRSLSAKFGVLEALSEQLRRGLRKALKYILDMVNAVVGSIKAALGPAGVVADAIAELKDMIKAKIDIANGW
ncbi:hypothetical protein [Jhaorihella thermophila]|uniref:Uncharacterized protein n=1 Tax=Jhaorihella thermophila TaxID=488547 RepID=A0A1H5ZKJ6_9RHOB|nr:hypothetical protein [Jhaorihella thermophila]SEG36275.1 hypothetical protein SAMN05421751_1451 [Jhaorihella thermophila]